MRTSIFKQQIRGFQFSDLQHTAAHRDGYTNRPSCQQLVPQKYFRLVCRVRPVSILNTR